MRARLVPFWLVVLPLFSSACMTGEAVDWASPEVNPVVNVYGKGFGETLFVDIKNTAGIENGTYAVRLLRTANTDQLIGRLSRVGERSPQFWETPEEPWTPFSILEVAADGTPTGDYEFAAKSADAVSVYRTEAGEIRVTRWNKDAGSGRWTKLDEADIGKGEQSTWRPVAAWGLVPLAVVGDLITLPLQLLLLPFAFMD